MLAVILDQEVMADPLRQQLKIQSDLLETAAEVQAVMDKKVPVRSHRRVAV